MAVFKRSDWLRFVQLHVFDQEWSDLGLEDDELQSLQNAIMAAPERNPRIEGTGGLRKIRFADKRSKRGKRGAYRVGYVFFPQYETVLLVTVWGKNEKDDLTAADRAAIRKIIEEIERLLDRGKL